MMMIMISLPLVCITTTTINNTTYYYYYYYSRAPCCPMPTSPISSPWREGQPPIRGERRREEEERGGEGRDGNG